MIKIDFLKYIGKETLFGKQTWFGYMWLPTSEQWIRWKRNTGKYGD